MWSRTVRGRTVKVKLVPYSSLQRNMMTVMVPGGNWRQEAGHTRYVTVKKSTSLFLLVVLQVGQDPSRWSQDGEREHADSNDSFLHMRHGV